MSTQKCWRIKWTAAILLGAVASGITIARADDLKVSQLEQDVRDLKQQLLQLTRRIDQLESELARSSEINRRPVERPAPHASETTVGDSQRAWLNIASWDRVRVGMSVLDVLQLLGPPTTLRKSKDGVHQTLLYALEVGTGNFLSGSVELDNQQVVAVTKPSLK